jgi:general secretion pathway protein D
MNFVDAPVDTILDQLSAHCGLSIVKEGSIEGKFTIISKQPSSVDDAVSLLNAVLKEKGYFALRTGKILKVLKLDEAKKRNIPVRTGSDPEQIQPSDEMITQVIPIKYLDAIQLKKDFAPLVPAYADLSANASSNTLIVTDTSANVRRIVELVHAMDTQTTSVAEVKVFQLKFANATSAARLIMDIFKEDTSQNAGNLPGFLRNLPFFGGGRGGFGGPPGAAGQPAEQTGQRLRKVTASADERTNAVVVSANPETMHVIAQIMKDLDANPSEAQSVFVFHCKNAQSANLEGVVNTLFGSSGQSRSGATTQRPNSVTTTTTPGSTTGFARSTSSSPGGTNNVQAAFNNIPSRPASTASVPAGLTGDLTGQVFVVADTDTNSLLVLTASKNFERVKSILTDLDRPVPQVLIKVLIAEVTHTNGSTIGVQPSVLSGTGLQAINNFGLTPSNRATASSSATGFGPTTPAETSKQTSSSITSPTTSASQSLSTGFTPATALQVVSGGLTATMLAHNQDIAATLVALEQFGKVEVLSRPYILATDNQPSQITVGQEVPIVTNSMLTDTGQTINTIQYQTLGIILNVTAHINEDGLVIMDIAPQVSQIDPTSSVTITNGVTAPIFDIRSAQCRAEIKNGETIVIGGMMQDSKNESIQGIPVLDRIPGLGILFRNTTTSKSKTELLFFLTPHAALEPETLNKISSQEKQALKLTPKAVGPGAFKEHMRGLERGGEVVPLEEQVKPDNK